MAVPRETVNLRLLHAVQSGNAMRQWTTFRQTTTMVFKHLDSRQSIDGFWHRRCRRRGEWLGHKTLTKAAIQAQHFNGGEGFGLEAQQLTSVGHTGLPADGKVLALVTIRPAAGLVRTGRVQNYCSNFMTVCMSVLACANTAVAACCMIWVRAISVLAAA
jgi:hypothetical protein